MLVKDNIFCFEVPVFYIKLWVEVSEGEYDLSRNEFDLVFIESANMLQLVEELTTFDIIHNKVDSIVLLKNEVHLNDEWVLYS